LTTLVGILGAIQLAIASLGDIDVTDTLTVLMPQMSLAVV